MALVRTPRRAWIEQGLKALAQGGPEAVRVEVLAQALGVTKGGFYGFFADRRALLEAMLDAWEEEMIDEVIEEVDRGGGDARARLRRLFGIAGTADARELLAADLAIRDWARRDGAVANRLRRVDDRRMSYMRSLFAEFCPSDEEVEVRCMIAFSIWIGNHFIAAGHEGLSREKVMALTLERLET